MKKGTFDEWAVEQQLLTIAAIHCSETTADVGGTNMELELGGVSELLVVVDVLE